MKCYKRIITFFLAFAMLVSMLSFASAAEPVGVLEDSNSVAAWNAYIAGNLKDGASASSAQTAFWHNRNQVLSNAGIGELDSYSHLTKVTSALNRSGGGLVVQLADFIADTISSLFSSPDYLVMYDSKFGCYRPYDNRTGLWVVNSMGHFPYFPVDDPAGSTSPVPQFSYQWLRTNQISWNGGIAIVSYMELKDILSLGYDGYIERRGNYLHIFDRASDGTMVLCSEEGFPLSAISDISSTAVGTPNNYYTEEGDTVNNYDQGDTIYNEFLDITNNTTWFPNGVLQYIDKIVYDESTKTYTVDSHDSYTYNSTTNNYVTNNYHYEYNYHIDYTSVTYIGQTEEYEEEYRYYYQLPDGRSSADLTAEDLEQLSLAFSDVVQYARSADDISLRSLYHFDGNVEDDSYWGYCTDFVWNSGASLTYMDEGTFGGSLYLDETEHDFALMLPCAGDALGDFTLQFRYYQSYTAAPVTDSYIAFGGSEVLKMNGASYLLPSGTEICAISVGAWNEICLMRSNGVLYYYVNGVPVTSVSNPTSFGSTVNFYFGTGQQTYKKLDELRFTKNAVYTPGLNYSPTSVPFDTNLSLILPDGEYPIADEIPIFTPGDGNLFDAVGLSDWSTFDVVSKLTTSYSASQYPLAPNPLKIYYSSGSITFTNNGSSVGISIPSAVNLNLTAGVSYMKNGGPQGCFFMPLYYDTGSTVSNRLFPVSTSCVLSIVYSDGLFDSFTFYDSSINSNSASLVVTSTGCGRMICAVGKVGYSSYQKYTGGLLLYPAAVGSEVDISYMELVEGTSAGFSFKYEQAVYSSGELKNSPVLAVRTNQKITGYQIGGVRPSYPEKGQIWAMVENGRICSLQQYTGSVWNEVDGRIWTGERWIPYSSFDVFLLKDCYDVQGIVTGDDYEYIYTESGFWAWFQRQWLAFISKMDQILEAVQDISGTGGSDLNDGELFPDANDPSFEDGSWGVLDLLVAVKDGVWHFVTGVVTAGFDGLSEFVIGIVRMDDLFEAFDESNENGIFIPVEEGGSVWD